MTEYRERELKRKIKIHELQIEKHRKRIERAQDKIYICENELKEMEPPESYLSDFDAKRLKSVKKYVLEEDVKKLRRKEKSSNDGSAEHVKDYLNDLKGE